MSTATSDTTTLSKHAALTHLLRKQIVDGDLSPGDRLPSFSEFKTRFGAASGTVEKVLTTLEREGLVERFHGKGIFVAQKSKGNKCIGFLCRQRFRVGGGYYWTPFIEGIEEGAHAAGYNLLLVNPDFATAWQDKVDGVIFYEGDPETVSQLPAIMRLRVMLSSPGMASVIPDEMGGAYQATQHLISLGHRRIAYLAGNYLWPMQLRLMGYRAALAEAGISEERGWVRVFEGGNSPKIGAESMRDWLAADWKQLGCTAMLCHNDQVTLGVIEALQEEGLHVPDDVSLIGFDGTALSEMVHPKLTSIQVPMREIGLRASALLIEQIESGKYEPISLTIPTTLKLGNTTAPLPSKPR